MMTQDVHSTSLATSTAISEYYVPDFITPLEVIRVLNTAKVRFLLCGHHGLSGWMKKPRATEDVDVLVAARQHKKAVRALLQAFPDLEEVDLPVVARLRVRGSDRVAIDVMKPLQQPYVAAFKHTRRVTTRDQSYLIPSLELALTMKFSAMTSLYRADLDKLQDAHDFGHIVLANTEIDLETLAELGSLIYPDGGRDLLEMVRRVRAGEKLIL